MNPIYTYIFLFCSFIVLFPVGFVGWDMFKARNVLGADRDVRTLARAILYITAANILFHAAQFATVFLGFMGWSMQARIPIILMVDGSLVLLAIVYVYAFFKIRAVRERHNKL